MTQVISSFCDLQVYSLAFELQQEVFRISRQFPKEETYSLTDQIRRSSRSIGANLAEAWQKRRYAAHFVSKLSDADGIPRRSCCASRRDAKPLAGGRARHERHPRSPRPQTSRSRRDRTDSNRRCPPGTPRARGWCRPGHREGVPARPARSMPRGSSCRTRDGHED